MAVTVSYPGVYVDEFAPAPPIQGVGTSVAAFLGPAMSGPVLEPQLVTSWDAFTQIYGREPIPGFHLWYALRGFFENEGRLAYIVRISNAAHASFKLLDRVAASQKPTVIVEAREAGALGNSLKVSAVASQALTQLAAFAHTAPIVVPEADWIGAVCAKAAS